MVRSESRYFPEGWESQCIHGVSVLIRVIRAGDWIKAEKGPQGKTKRPGGGEGGQRFFFSSGS